MTDGTQTATTLSPQTLRAWIDTHEDLIVIDVRSAAEFETQHIRGSYNVPLPLLSEHTEDLAERLGKRVVLVCQSGVRAEQARQRLDGAGIGSALILEGGVPAFAAAGGDVVRGAQRWALERQVRMAAGGLVVAGLVAGKFVSPKLRALSGAIGAGLAFSAATNTCAMGNALAKMPWNKTASEPSAADAIGQIPAQN
ncbi:MULTISPECIES: rhodanese-like domain-containing protein [unclassified Sinomonas]|uniref:rhodanese-like domain-containing protein n=1 Tax=unclassified Sinomonas TaxID=2646595 RepID=UPI000B61D653|nr:rhodanese-like domain-containing protein [Sinomonas sp. R1AF57]ASN50752.1 sulfurtransferase [Sinomonas sp. R1AF57]